jgi:putative acetyltransferase
MGESMYKKRIWLLLCLAFCPNLSLAEPVTEPMKVEYIDAVKEIIIGCYFELTRIPFASIGWVRIYTQLSGSLKDIDNFQQEYMTGGSFFVVTDNKRVVGMGAIRKIDNETAELRRVYFLKEYRGRGLASAIVKKLLQAAREHGYKKLRLEVDDVQKQQAAVNLYKKCGFYEIPPYKANAAQLSMEAVI